MLPTGAQGVAPFSELGSTLALLPRDTRFALLDDAYWQLVNAKGTYSVTSVGWGLRGTGVSYAHDTAQLVVKNLCLFANPFLCLNSSEGQSCYD